MGGRVAMGTLSCRNCPSFGIAIVTIHSMAVRRGAGSVFVWGSECYGRLELRDMFNRQAPTVAPALRGVSLVAAGWCNVLSLGVNGIMMAWGDNRSSKSGLGIAYINSRRPW